MNDLCKPRTAVRWIFAALLMSGALAFAQAVPAEMPVAGYGLTYQSVIAQYKAHKDQPTVSWREANDRVGQIGGWRAYAQEMRQAPPAGEAASPGHDAHGGARP